MERDTCWYVYHMCTQLICFEWARQQTKKNKYGLTIIKFSIIKFMNKNSEYQIYLWYSYSDSAD